jgi:predicted permease
MEEWLGELWYGYAPKPRWKRLATLPKHVFGLFLDFRTVRRIGQSHNPPNPARATFVLRSLVQDIQYGLRSLRAARRTSLLVVITLGIGIGASASIFGVVNSLLLTPLQYTDANRLVILWEDDPGMSSGKRWLSAAQFADIRDLSQVFESVALVEGRSAPITGYGDAEELGYIQASSTFFQVFGTGPALGRVLTEGDDRDGAQAVIVLTHALWQRKFGSDSTVIGRGIRLDVQDYVIVGVLPEAFVVHGQVLPSVRGISHFDYITSLQLSERRLNNRDRHNYNVVGKLNPGVSVTQAQAEVDVLTSRFEEEAASDTDGAPAVTVTPLLDEVVGHVRPALYLLLGSAGILLLIACANVANLLLSRGSVRQRELGICAALGAGRWRLMIRLMAESLALAILGGFLGFGVSAWSLVAIRALDPVNLPRIESLQLDTRVLIFCVVLSLITCVLSGLLPAIKTTQVDVIETLKGAGRGRVGRGVFQPRFNAPDWLVVTEIALSLVLLVAGGLLARSFIITLDVDPGFRAENRLSLETILPEYREREGWREFHSELQRRLRALPDIQAVGAGWPVPLSNKTWSGSLDVDGHERRSDEQPMIAAYAEIWPGFMETLGVSLVEGRFFDERDIASGAEPTAIVDELVARRISTGGSPIDMRVGDSDHQLSRIVGVVRHVRRDRLDQDGRMTVYFPPTQGAIPWYLILHTRNEPADMVPLVRQEIASLDPNVAVADIQTMSERRAERYATHRLSLLLVASFSGVALILAAVGIFGVVSYRVNQGAHEIAMRKALGATDSNIQKLVVRQGLKLAGVGVVVGLGGALVLTRFIRSLLFGISSTDPQTYVLLTLFLFFIVFLSCYGPALRAMRLEPMKVLTNE